VALAPNSEIAIGSPVVQRDVVYVTGGYPLSVGLCGSRRCARRYLTPAGRSSSDSILWSHDRDWHLHLDADRLCHQLTRETQRHPHRYDSEKRQAGVPLARRRRPSPSRRPGGGRRQALHVSEDGDIVVLEAGRQYVELAKNAMGEVVMATPAISDGIVVIRTSTRLGIGR
jgi:hypothetical protein